MFRGTFEYSLDDKGRVSVPAKFRKALNPDADETFVIVRGPNNCLRAFPLDVWRLQEKQLDERPQTPETTKLRRYLYAAMSDSQLDNQGRVTIVESQFRGAGIDKKVLLVGQGSYIEIWGPEQYSAYLGDAKDFDEVYYHSVQDGAR